ncbi:MAG TPA: cellobiose phosphorylase, partial [Arthrobacter sp.]
MNQHVDAAPKLSTATRRQLLAGAAAFAVTGFAAATAKPGFAAVAAGPASGLTRAGNLGGIDRKVINRWAQDTWKSL